MVNALHLRETAQEFLCGGLSLDDFEDWFLSHSWNAHLDSDPRIVAVVHRIEGLLLDLSVDAIDEVSFREELDSATRPFALPAQIATMKYGGLQNPQEVTFDVGPTRKPPMSVQWAGARQSDLQLSCV